MKATDPWFSLRAGKVTTGLRLFQKNYDRQPTASHIMELGVACLWVEQYERAWKLFRKAVEEYPHSMSSFYGMAGAAAWCLGNVAEAVGQWRNGLESSYADTDGLGIHLPLLLLTASILRPGSFETQMALRILRKKARDHRVQEWPGPIALLALGEICKGQLQNHCSAADDLQTQDREWLATFYEAVLTYRVGESAILKRTMQSLADIASPPWANQEFFLVRMWSEEFFIARHEAVNRGGGQMLRT